MLILKNNLTKDDYEFASIDLKALLQVRDTADKTLDLDKFIIPLAERGQVEAMEMYFSNHSPVLTLNSKIVSNFAKLEQKSVKEPREHMALAAFYKWYLNYYKYNIKPQNVEELDVYKKYHYYYNCAFQELYRRGKLDPIANQYAFLMRQNTLGNEEYLRSLSNIRNQIYAMASMQVKEETKLKLNYAYAKNLIMYASTNEFESKKEFIIKIISDLQRNLYYLGDGKDKNN